MRKLNAPLPIPIDDRSPGLKFLLYTLDVGTDKVNMLPQEFVAGESGGYRTKKGFNFHYGQIPVRQRRCKIRFHGASNLTVPLQLFDSDSQPPSMDAAGGVNRRGNEIEFSPGDSFTEFLEDQWLCFDQPWLIRLKTTHNQTTVTSNEAAPVASGSEGVNVAGADSITLTVGAHTYNAATVNYRLEIYAQATTAWTKLFETTLTGAWSQNIALNGAYSRLYARIAEIKGDGTGAEAVSKSYSSDGIVAPATATLFLSAWYESEIKGDSSHGSC